MAPEEDGNLGVSGSSASAAETRGRAGWGGWAGSQLRPRGPEGALALFWVGDQAAVKPE